LLRKTQIQLAQVFGFLTNGQRISGSFEIFWYIFLKSAVTVTVTVGAALHVEKPDKLQLWWRSGISSAFGFYPSALWLFVEDSVFPRRQSLWLGRSRLLDGLFYIQDRFLMIYNNSESELGHGRE
jgi:hypothetical protein